MDIVIDKPIDEIETNTPIDPPRIFKCKRSRGNSTTYSFTTDRIYETLGMNKSGQLIIACDLGVRAVLSKTKSPTEYLFRNEADGLQACFLAYDVNQLYEEMVIVYADGIGGDVILAASPAAKNFYKSLKPELPMFEEKLEQGLHHVYLKWQAEEDIDNTIERYPLIIRIKPVLVNVSLSAALKGSLGLL